jgi:streptomycin 6-kinase
MASWRCRPDGPPVATEASLLWPVRLGAEALMLKLPDPDDEAGAWAILRAWDGRGAVRLEAGGPEGQLLERAPGPDLLSLVPERDEEAARILGDVAARLRAAGRAGPAPPGLIPLPERGRSLEDALRRELVPPAEQEAARRALDLLAAEGLAGAAALHGDLHHGNVLLSPRGWLALDPKGLWGAPAYDLANALCNPFGQTSLVADPARMARQAAILAERTGHAAPAMLAWAFVHGLLSAAWDGFGPEAAHALAASRTARALM